MIRARYGVPPALIEAIALLAVIITLYAGLGDIIKRPTQALVKSDFQAFYCGAAVAAAHADPYALTPLQHCQAYRLPFEGGVDPASAGVDPDPLPGYTIAFFMPLTHLPFRTAALAWDAVLLGTIFVTALLLGRLCGWPPWVVGAVLSYADGVASIRYGQLPPILTFGIVLCAFGLVHERRYATVVGAAIAMLEPHVGLPVYCALYVWRPALRAHLLVIAAILAAVSMTALSLPLNLEYLRVELPTHAAAEATTSIQYSLTWLLHYVGVGDAAAITIGSLQYAVFAVAAVVLANRVARGLGTVAALALFPAAAVLVGGSFIHIVQMTAAIPFGLLVAARLRGAAARTAWLATALLAVPWPADWRLGLVGAMAIVATIALSALRDRPLLVAVSVAAISAVLYFGVAGPVLGRMIPAQPRHIVAAAPPMPRALDGDRLASEEDAREARADPDFAVATPQTLAAKLPTWFGLGMLIWLALRAARKAMSANREPAPA